MSIETGEPANVESMFAEAQATPVTDELEKLRSVLVEQLPRDALIKFEFDGKLRVHLDVRRFEDVAHVEALLPSLAGGIYRDLQRGLSRHNSFLHRVTASVRR
ncbi:hypothetical protein ACFQPG_01205 [Sphingomonas sp. GCM10030256]|uniref:hypothetical protein n=1 Tax=Sphingomonas sp. GCM10030256 TaxID=3273427 RepID=UPI00361BB8C9